MKVGDLVTAYWKGLFEIISIQRCWAWKTPEIAVIQRTHLSMEYNPETCGQEVASLLTIIQRYSSSGKPMKAKRTKLCYSDACKPANIFIPQEIKRLEAIIENLKQIKYEQ